MRKVRDAFLVFFIFALTACASPYEEGKSSNDVPAHVDVIKLKDIYMTTMFASKDSNGNLERDINPSTNDQEVTALAKASIIDQFTNFGYKVVEGNAPADINAQFFLSYQPERWPLVDRAYNVSVRIYNSSDVPLFKIHNGDVNAFGLVGAIVGPSRDEMVSSTTRKAVVKTVEELRKGTFENKTVEKSPDIHADK